MSNDDHSNLFPRLEASGREDHRSQHQRRSMGSNGLGSDTIPGTDLTLTRLATRSTIRPRTRTSPAYIDVSQNSQPSAHNHDHFHSPLGVSNEPLDQGFLGHVLAASGRLQQHQAGVNPLAESTPRSRRHTLAALSEAIAGTVSSRSISPVPASHVYGQRSTAAVTNHNRDNGHRTNTLKRTLAPPIPLAPPTSKQGKPQLPSHIGSQAPAVFIDSPLHNHVPFGTSSAIFRHTSADHPHPIGCSSPNADPPPSAPVQIPIARRPNLDAHTTIPLTARFREESTLQRHIRLGNNRRRQISDSLRSVYLVDRPISDLEDQVAPTTNSTSPAASSPGSSLSSASCEDLPIGQFSPPVAAQRRERRLSGQGRYSLRRRSSSPCGRKLLRLETPRSPTIQLRRPSPMVFSRSPMRSTASTSLNYTPTSPLSSSAPKSTSPSTKMQQSRSPNPRSRRLQQEFQLPLPKFHPAVYQSPSSSNNTSAMNTPRNVRPSGGLKPPAPPRQQPRQYSDAQRKLEQYQQELRYAVGAAGTGPMAQHLPGTPSLLPCGSPGPTTPLTLEDGPGDYLIAGVVKRGTTGDAGSQREVVERIIRNEEERRHGGAMHSGPSSPPLSPGGGP